MRPTLWIYGPVPPEPKGGVTSFMRRLLADGRVPVAGIIDPYHGKKDRLDVFHHVPARAGVAERLKTTAKLVRYRDKPLLVNISKPGALVRLAPFLVGREAPTALIFHHGILKAANGVMRWLVRRVLARIDRIFCLSERQREHLLALGIDEAKLQLVDAYLAPAPSDSGIEAAPTALRKWLASSDSPLLMGSGFAMDIYQHDWPARSIMEDKRFANCRYLLCCYGPKTDELTQLRDLLAGDTRLYLSFGLEEDVFISLLREADIYVRPTVVDSFGIALHDALHFGALLVASDARERPPGSFVHDAADESAYRDALAEALAALSSGARPPTPGQHVLPLIDALCQWLEDATKEEMTR